VSKPFIFRFCLKAKPSIFLCFDLFLGINDSPVLSLGCSLLLVSTFSVPFSIMSAEFQSLSESADEVSIQKD
jgi:hypothetical protein